MNTPPEQQGSTLIRRTRRGRGWWPWLSIMLLSAAFILPTANVSAAPLVRRIVATHSSKCLDVPYASHTSGIDLQQYSCHDQNNQKWELRPLPNSSYYAIVNVESGLCMDVENGSIQNGAIVQQYSCHYGQNQQWRLLYVGVSNGRSVYEIQNVHSSIYNPYTMCLDVANARLTNGGPIVQWQCHGGAHQRWTLQ